MVMAYSPPPAVAALAVESGTAKAHLGPGRALVGGFLAGAYIAFGGLLAIVASAGLDPKLWGGITTVVTGGVFSLGLILVIVGGAELLTGNMALIPMAVLERRVTIARRNCSRCVSVTALPAAMESRRVHPSPAVPGAPFLMTPV
jgi:formate/nitrite transporter FocA (FNT family)